MYRDERMDKIDKEALEVYENEAYLQGCRDTLMVCADIITHMPTIPDDLRNDILDLMGELSCYINDLETLHRNHKFCMVYRRLEEYEAEKRQEKHKEENVISQ